MNDPREVLVGVEFDATGEQLTQGASHALRDARLIAARAGAHLTLLHSTARDEYFHPVDRAYVVVSEGVSRGGRAALEALVAETRESGTSCDLVYSGEAPYLALVHQAVASDAGLVVVSRHDESRPDDRRMGRVTQRVVHACPMPVLVTAQEVYELESDKRCALAATDLMPVGAAAVKTACFLAERADAELHVVHAYSLPLQVQMAASSPEAIAEAENELAKAARQAVREQLAGTSHAESAHVHVGLGSPERVLTEAVEHLRPLALVLGSVSREGVAGVLLGNTAEQLLNRLDCALVVIKPAGFVAPI